MNNTTSNKSKRHSHFINTGLQSRLIVSLVLLELLLIGLAVFVVYMDVNQIIEDNMFRSHIQNTLTIEYFAGRVMQIMLVLLLVNVVVVSFVVWRWREFVNAIVIPLEKIANSIYALDFRLREENSVHHQAVIIADQWQLSERDCFNEIRQCISALNVDDTVNMSEQVFRCKELIKKNSSD